MSNVDAGMAAAPRGKIPVTMLSGFLGAGKTTLLKHVLENSSMKVACLVNDVASINIDAKLIRNRGKDAEQDKSKSAVADLVELQNGCACYSALITGCSAADELFPSFAQIVAMGERRGEPFDRIILENSGVAEPQNIRDSFVDAAMMGHPLLEKIDLGCLITVVDSACFIKDYSSRVPLSMRPDLGEGGTLRPVVDLLVEQIECADVVILNKADLLSENSLNKLPTIVASLNPLARVLSCTHGKIPVDVINQPGLIAKLNVEGQHRSAVVAAKGSGSRGQHHAQNATGDHPHSHGEHEHHEHGHKHHEHKPHEHEHHDHAHHGHDHHGHDHHGHDHHGHDHHSHDHHGHDHHGHEHHDHNHDTRQQTTAAERFGIRSFVYSRRRPFHPARLRDLVLRWLPAQMNTALQGEAPGQGDRPIKKVLRSKGFTWLSNNHVTAFYWSHAGQYFELREEGDWWAAVDEREWPIDGDVRDVVLSDFHEGYGDRRQELVFIGANMNEEEICAQLDEALLTDDEFQRYAENWSRFPDPPHPGIPGKAA